MKEILTEIIASISKNKLRTALTGFSVAWGIFMLIILLGSGNGLKNGVTSNFEGRSTSKINMGGGRTQKAYAGYQKNRLIKLKYEDIEEIKKNIKNVDNVGAIRYSNGKIKTDHQQLDCSISGVTPNIKGLNSYKIIDGRFISQTDIINKSKSVVLNNYSKNVLFKNKNAIGEKVIIDEITYTVVGVFKEVYESNNTSICIPITTSLFTYTKTNYIDRISLEGVNITSKEESDELMKEIRAVLGQKHSYAKDDNGAIWVWSAIVDFLQTMMIFNGITMFVWVIGLGTLMAGVVGVSNIMLVTVRERTNEFGIRKSMGATPASLVRLILLESIIITTVFGYIGLILGTATMEGVSFILEHTVSTNVNENAPTVFKNPTIDLSIALMATVVLIIAGTIAGYVPARRASKLKTIDALRYNK